MSNARALNDAALQELARLQASLDRPAVAAIDSEDMTRMHGSRLTITLGDLAAKVEALAAMTERRSG